MSDETLPEQIAGFMHETYERLAPSVGYETRSDTKQFNPLSPNGRLMIAVCAETYARAVGINNALCSDLAAARADAERAKAEHEAMKFTVVTTIKGTVEGEPTSEINYLQRLREMLGNEAQLAALSSECEALRKGLFQIRYVMKSIKGARVIAHETLVRADAARAAGTGGGKT